MSNINWDLAPEGAVELRELKSGVCLRWFNKQGEYFSGSGWEFSTSDYNVIAIRPTQTKTVADAVEWHKNTYGTLRWQGSCTGLVFSDGKWLFTDPHKAEDLVCTRAEFEAYMKELPNFKATRENLENIAKDAQGDFVEVEEGEKWTHTYFNIRCRIMDLDPDEFGTVVIIKNGGDYALAHPSKLIPIKPTIKPSAAWSLVSKQGWPIHQVTETYDVEEVPAND